MLRTAYQFLQRIKFDVVLMNAFQNTSKYNMSNQFSF